MDRQAIIGRRLKRAREGLGLTQEEIAKRLKIGRPRYSDIENGKRDIQLKDLYRFAEFYNRPVNYFIKENLFTDNGFKVLFRKTAGDKAIAHAVTEFENLCEKMCELGNISNYSIKAPVCPDYEFERSREWHWGRYYAERERRALDVGQAPLHNLIRILEKERGLKIFHLPVPPGRGVYGMFTYGPEMGGCILINSNPVHGNQLFSLAHEYAHYLFHKDKLGIISTERDRNSSVEKIANAFAGNFLMPESAVKNLFASNTRKDANAEDILFSADYFGVSFQAMLYRLNNLRLINDAAKEELLNNTSIAAVRKSIGFAEPEGSVEKFPRIYKHLACKAFLQGKLTTSRFAEFLEIPLYRAMELGRSLRGSLSDEAGTPV